MRKSAAVTTTFLILLALTAFANAQTLMSGATGHWTPAVAMSQARSGAASVLLSDGRILISGGSDASGAPSASAEFFNTDGSFSAAPPMSIPRSNHAAILLQTGQVLVTGGTTSGGGVTNSAELFDPASNTWQPLLAPMVNARTGHAVAELQDGNILLIGGNDSAGPVTAIEMFTLFGQQFQFLTTLLTPRTNAAAAAMPNGDVLIAGGTGDLVGGIAGPLASTEIFTYSSILGTGVVTAGPNLASARSGAAASTTYDGVAIIGGTNGSSDLGTAEIYSEWSHAFRTVTGGTPRSGGLAMLLPHNGSVLVTGGTGGSATDLLEPWANNIAGGFVAALPSISDHSGGFVSATFAEGLMLAAGGNGPAGTSAELYRFPTVATDQNDYAPGTSVIMSGTGWSPGETVTLHLAEWVNGNITNYPDYTVTADASGNFQLGDYAPTPTDLGARYHLTAIGQSSAWQAQTVFTDATNVSTTTVLNAISNSLSAGQTSVTFAGTVTSNDASHPVPSGGLVQLQFKAGTSCSGAALLTSTTINAAGGFSSIFTAPTTSGSYSYQVQYQGDSAGSGSGAVNWQKSTSSCQTVTINPATAAKYVVTSNNFAPVAGTAVTITAQLTDTFGNPVTTAGKVVTWTKTGTGGFFASPTSTTNASGLATVSFTTSTVAGTVHTVTATDGGSLTGTSSNITTVVGPLHHFAFDTISSPQTTGIGFNITIRAQDINNNTVTTFSGSSNKVVLTSTGALVGAPITTLAFTLGVVTQSVTFSNSGNFTITASGIGGNSSITGLSNAFDVSAPCTATAVTTNPSDQTVLGGNTATFTAAASGSPSPTVQWQVSTNGGGSFSNISGATSTTLSFTATASQNGNKYQAVFTNSCGGTQTATTTAATLNVQEQITVDSSQPGLQVKVDGTTHAAPYKFTDTIGAQHSISVDSPQSAGAADTRYVWSSWSDSGVQTHNITISASILSYTASFTTQYKLTLAVTAGVPNGLTNISGGSNGTFYDDGTVLSLAANTPVADGPGKQWAFKNWAGDVAGAPNTNNPVSVTMNQARFITANYGVQWQLTIAVTAGVPNGTANVSGGFNGTFYDDGTVLSLSSNTPVADGTDKRWVFKNWTGDVITPPDTNNPVSVTMNQARSVMANYGAEYKLTLAITSGVPNGLTNITGGVNGTFYADGTVLSLAANTPVADGPGKQWAFKNWTGDVAGAPNTNNPVSVTMNQARSITANYGVQWQLTIAVTAGVPNGTANVSGGTNAAFYDDGTVLNLAANTPVADGPGKQWAFKNWTGDVAGSPNTNNPVSVTMNQARFITANYGVQWQLTIAVTAGVPNGTANVSGGTNGTFYDNGTVLNLAATTPVADGPGKQWAFKNWTGDVAGAPNTNNPVSVTMNQARSITANYGVQWQLTIAVTAGVPNGTANVSGGFNGTFYDDGTVLSLSANTPVADGPGKQWAFKNWAGDVAGAPNTNNPVSVTMNQARSITANYGVQWQLTIAVTAGVPNGTANVSGGFNGTFYDDGTVLSLSSNTPVADGTDKRWVFKNWTGDVITPPDTNNPVSVTMNQARSVMANYGAEYKLTLAITSGVPNGLTNITGGVNGTFYADGTVLSLAANTPVADGPGKQWAFKNWTGDVAGAPNTNNPVSVTMNQARFITANYGVQWQLTIAVTAGVPNGTANVSGGTNAAFYDDGTVLNLAANTPVADGPGKQWAFKNWTGDVAGSPNTNNPVSVTMNQARFITANYGVQWQLTIAVTAGVPNGTANVSGGTNGTFYDNGTVLNLAATTPVADGLNKRWLFVNWTGDATSSTTTVSVTMTAPRSENANYQPQYDTQTGVVSSVNPSILNQPVTFTATISTIVSGPTPTGSVQFKVDGSNYGSSVSLAGGIATLNTSTLAVGNHSIGAVYSSNTDTFTNSNGSLSGGQSVNYNVCYLYDQTKSVKRNATVPIKVQACDANGADYSSSSIVVTATTLVPVSSGASAILEDSGNANPDSNFRYDPTLGGATGGYIFNLSTKNVPTGTWNLIFTISGEPSGMTHQAMFGVK